eukprot:m.282435 g.282435  ORF g.282435 m.282435 type:complete len:101 (+) comp40653_c0_seq7:154-456(+)
MQPSQKLQTAVPAAVQIRKLDFNQQDVIECCIVRFLVKKYWSPWSAWSSCSATCGVGKKTRTRTCARQTAAYSCSITGYRHGASKHMTACNAFCCPVDRH